MSARVNGVAGRILDVWPSDMDTMAVAQLANDTGFSAHQLRTALARLRRMGKVQRVRVDVWRRVAEVQPIKIGDRVRCIKSPSHRAVRFGDEGTVFAVDDICASVRMAGYPDTCFLYNEIERVDASDPDPVPWFPPKPRPIAWAVQTRPDVPDYALTPLQRAGVVR